MPGGELSIRGNGFSVRNHTRPQVQFGTAEASLIMAADNLLIARVPEGAAGGAVRVRMGSVESAPFPVALGVQIADNLHPVGNPAVDPEGNVYVTFSGQRGQKVPVSLYKITSNHTVKPFITELMNPTGLALDQERLSFCLLPQRWHHAPRFARRPRHAVDRRHGHRHGDRLRQSRQPLRGRSQRHDFQDQPGARNFRFRHAGTFDRGLPSGVQPGGRIVRHRADDFELRPRLSNFSGGRSQRILSRARAGRRDWRSTASAISTWPDRSAGKRGIVRLTPQAEAEVVLGGSNIVGLALLPSHRAMIATNNALFTLDWDVEGLPLNG